MKAGTRAVEAAKAAGDSETLLKAIEAVGLSALGSATTGERAAHDCHGGMLAEDRRKPHVIFSELGMFLSISKVHDTDRFSSQIQRYTNR